MANPFPFVSGNTLLAAELNGIGESVAFTPTWNASLTVGNGTQSFRYVRVNNFVFISGKFTLGSTSAITGNTSFATPVTSTNQADVSIVGQAYLSDSGVGAQIGLVAYSGNQLFVQGILVNATYPSAQGFAASTPFTWSVNDSFTVNIVYTV
jgi:hypothetical protein